MITSFKPQSLPDSPVGLHGIVQKIIKQSHQIPSSIPRSLRRILLVPQKSLLFSFSHAAFFQQKKYEGNRLPGVSRKMKKPRKHGVYTMPQTGIEPVRVSLPTGF